MANLYTVYVFTDFGAEIRINNDPWTEIPTRTKLVKVRAGARITLRTRPLNNKTFFSRWERWIPESDKINKDGVPIPQSTSWDIESQRTVIDNSPILSITVNENYYLYAKYNSSVSSDRGKIITVRSSYPERLIGTTEWYNNFGTFGDIQTTPSLVQPLVSINGSDYTSSETVTVGAGSTLIASTRPAPGTKDVLIFTGWRLVNRILSTEFDFKFSESELLVNIGGPYDPRGRIYDPIELTAVYELRSRLPPELIRFPPPEIIDDPPSRQQRREREEGRRRTSANLLPGDPISAENITIDASTTNEFFEDFFRNQEIDLIEFNPPTPVQISLPDISIDVPTDQPIKIDPISKAISIASGVSPEKIETTANSILQSKNTANQKLNQKLSQLPTDTDPFLLLRKKEANILRRKAKVQEQILNNKEKRVNMVRDTITKISRSFSIPSIFSRPLPDLKIIQSVRLAKQLKSLAKEKTAVSRENIKRGVELYSYPINKIEEITVEDPFPRNRNLQPPTIKPRLPFRNG